MLSGNRTNKREKDKERRDEGGRDGRGGSGKGGVERGRNRDRIEMVKERERGSARGHSGLRTTRDATLHALGSGDAVWARSYGGPLMALLTMHKVTIYSTVGRYSALL